MPKSRTRKKPQQAQARRTQAQQKDAHKRALSPRAYKTRRILGWSLVVVAVTVGVSHFLAHLGVWSFASPGVMDLAAGYPMAVFLGVAGAIVLSKT